MIDQLDELYRDVILEHFKHSAHAGELSDAQIHATGSNPLCGDEIQFDVKMNRDRIERVRFHGKGCAISQATSSMLAQELEGKSVAEARQLIEALKGLMQGQEPKRDVGDLEALAGVRKFPVRVKCAALSWSVVEQGLSSYQQRP